MVLAHEVEYNKQTRHFVLSVLKFIPNDWPMNIIEITYIPDIYSDVA